MFMPWRLNPSVQYVYIRSKLAAVGYLINHEVFGAAMADARKTEVQNLPSTPGSGPTVLRANAAQKATTILSCGKGVWLEHCLIL